MVVEDFTVSEMVAANCDVTETDIALVQQMSCYVGTEPVFDTYEKKQAYVLFSDLYIGEKYDFSGDGKVIDAEDNCFTQAYHDASAGANICVNWPYEKDVTFGHGTPFTCTGDSSLVQNS